MSVREIAELLGCSKEMVYGSLKDYGIETRTNKRHSGLKNIKVTVLEKEVKKKSIRGYCVGMSDPPGHTMLYCKPQK